MGLFKKHKRTVRPYYELFSTDHISVEKLMQTAKEAVYEEEKQKEKKMLQQKDRQIKRLRRGLIGCCLVIALFIVGSIPAVQGFAERVYLQITGNSAAGEIQSGHYRLQLPLASHASSDEVLLIRYTYHDLPVLYQEIPIESAEHYTHANVVQDVFPYSVQGLSFTCILDDDGGLATALDETHGIQISVVISGAITQAGLEEILSGLVPAG